MRLQATENELRMRAASSLELGVEEKTFSASDDLPAEILLVAPRSTEAEALAHHLEEQNAVRCSIAETGFEAMRQVERSTIDAIIVSGATSLNGGESGFAERENPIDLIRALSSVEAGRHAAMIFVADATEPVSAEADAGRLARALDAGAADCAFVDREWDDLAARLRTHLKRKRSADRLRASLDDEMKNAVIDPLTGLHNRRYLNAHFARRFAWARENETPLAALMFDLDRFKSINDMHGHAVGDEALIAFAKVLRNELRVGDLVSRYGGEEFVVVMPGATLAQAAAAAERVRAKVAELRHDCSPRFGMTVSVGVASINQTDEAPEDLLRRADGALSAAKSRGRDCVDRA